MTDEDRDGSVWRTDRLENGELSDDDIVQARAVLQALLLAPTRLVGQQAQEGLVNMSSVIDALLSAADPAGSALAIVGEALGCQLRDT